MGGELHEESGRIDNTPAGGTVDSAPFAVPPAGGGFGPANNPDWVDSDWYREWLRLAQNPHFQ